MEVRYFQIIVPTVCLLFIYYQIRTYRSGKATNYETGILLSFWMAVIGVALFPDFFSKGVANVFGIKDNVNAIIFFTIALVFYFQFQFYKTLKKQDALLTEIARKIAMDNAEKK